MRKRVLALVLCVVLVISSAPTVFAQDEAPWRFGYAEYYSTYDPGMLLTDRYYYSDSWFERDPAADNNALALLSMQVTAAADDDILAGEFLQKLGFEQTGYASTDLYCNYTWGTKTVGTGEDAYTLVAVALQSYVLADQDAKRAGWRQNLTVNGGLDGQILSVEHDSYEAVTEDVMTDIRALGGSGNKKYWIMGNSRGGALAGMICARLQEYPGCVYGYTFEAPAYVESKAVVNPDAFSYIHNYLSTDDIVTMLPPWGMTRYGQERLIDTDEAAEQLADRLYQLGSPEAEAALSYDPEAVMLLDYLILDTLEEQIPTRADYSALRTETFEVFGEKITVTYSYQDVIVRVVDFILGGWQEVVPTDELMARILVLAGPVSELVEAVQCENLAKTLTDPEAVKELLDKANALYYMASTSLQEFLTEVGMNMPLSVDDLFVLLKLVGGRLVDSSITLPDEISPEDLVMIIEPAIRLISSVKDLVLAHHFDTTIARLKTLADESQGPEKESFGIEITEPKAGDPVDAAEAVAAFNALGYEWLIADAWWFTQDTVFDNNRVYYLNADLYVEGKTAADFTVTVNGKTPAEMSITYEGGVSIINAKWDFTVGTPAKVKVSYKANGHGKAPAAVQVDVGTRLATLPENDLGTIKDPAGWGFWQWTGWTDENGVPSQELTAEKDVILYAVWDQVIDNIELTYTAPTIGDPIGKPKTVKGAPFKIKYVSAHTADYSISGLEYAEKSPLYLNFEVHPTGNAKFFLQPDSFGDMDYAGALTVNGKQVEMYYDGDGNCILGCEYKFKPKAVKATKITSLKSASKGFKAKWKKVSGVTGYQLQYSLKKDFSSKKTKSTSKTSLTVSNLKKGKTYYVRVRSYRKVNGKTYYSKWCAKKKVKV